MRDWMRNRLAGICLVASLPLQAATISPFLVTAQITRGCLVGGGVSAYGVLDFGTRPALSTATLTSSLGGTSVTFQCTPGVAMTLRLDGGQHSADGSRQLQRAGGSQQVPYQLFSDPGLTQALLIGSTVPLSYSDPAAIRLPVYGRAQLPGTVPAGVYSDVVQVTVAW